MTPANQPDEANLTPKLSDGITPYFVPAGLIAACIKAWRGKTAEETPDESHPEATKEPIDGLPGVNNDGSPAFFRDADYRQERNYRESGWPQRSHALRNNGFGEGSRIPAGERCERKNTGVTKERERHIKGTHLPLRTTKGNVLGLRLSQVEYTGFGEGIQV